MPPLRNKQNRLSNFVFTLNNPTDLEIKAITERECVYLTYGREHFDLEGGTPHLQGCCQLGKQLAFSTVKRWDGFKRMHIEPMGGTIEQAIAYCHKEDKEPYVKGTPQSPGKRNDILEVVERIKAGETIKTIVTESDASAVVFVKYHRGLQQLQQQLTSERTEAPTVIWIWGKTGTGKTRSVLEFGRSFGDEQIWMSSENLQWFDGYTGQSIAIIDDYRTNFCKFSFFLRLLDRYSIRVPIKGGFTDWRPKFIFITSPRSASFTWDLRTSEDLQQLERRITNTIECEDYAQTKRRIYEICNGHGTPAILLGEPERIPIDSSDDEMLEELSN